MAQQAGRTVCPRCGANNFDTVAACWQCGAPLTAGLTPHVASASAGMTPRETHPYGPRPEAVAPPAYAAALPHATGDQGVARRAAIALALTLPWLGLPIGWAFMMIEDTRRQAIGRLCVTWSLFALVFHLLLMFVLAQSTVGLLREAAEIAAKANGRSSRDAGDGLPKLPDNP